MVSCTTQDLCVFINYTTVPSQALQEDGQWGADTFNPSKRGNNFITALHKLDHDREQVRGSGLVSQAWLYLIELRSVGYASPLLWKCTVRDRLRDRPAQVNRSEDDLHSSVRGEEAQGVKPLYPAPLRGFVGFCFGNNVSSLHAFNKIMLLHTQRRTGARVAVEQNASSHPQRRLHMPW